MDWLRLFKRSATPTKSATLTPSTAEPILDIVADALQQDDGLPFHPLSCLKGYDVFQIDIALKLRIANDLLLLTLMGREAELEGRVKEWASIPQFIVTLFVPDAERNKLRALSKGSPEYTKLWLKMMPSYILPDFSIDPKFGRLELLSSFADYCRKIGATDPLYWQKIYTRLELPYGHDCPSGNDPIITE